jgi:hypothetical protein
MAVMVLLVLVVFLGISNQNAATLWFIFFFLLPSPNSKAQDMISATIFGYGCVHLEWARARSCGKRPSKLAYGASFYVHVSWRLILFSVDILPL